MLYSWEHHHLSTPGRRKMILRRERAQPVVRAELRGGQAQLAILVLQCRDVVMQLRQPIAFLRSLEPNHQRRESDHRDQHAQHGGHHLRRPPRRFHPRAHRALRSIQRTLALRARALREVSAADGLITLRAISVYSPPRASAWN